MSLVSRPATAADVQAFYPEMSCSMKAWVCELNGKPEGIIGIALMRPIACMFSKFNEAMRPFLRHPTVLRLIKRAETAVKASRVPVWAVAEPGEPTAPKMLERLGFQSLGVVEGDLLYEWTPT